MTTRTKDQLDDRVSQVRAMLVDLESLAERIRLLDSMTDDNDLRDVRLRAELQFAAQSTSRMADRVMSIGYETLVSSRLHAETARAKADRGSL